MHSKTRCILLAVLALTLVPALVARSDDAAEKALRDRREALSKAVNAHDVKAMKSFIDPSYKSTTKEGQTITYDQLVQLIDQLFQTLKDFQETDKIEKIEVNGSTAMITVSETATFTDPNGNKQTQTDRDRETWKKIKNRWMLTGEEHL